MSSSVCRCYEGCECPLGQVAESFFLDVETDELISAVETAVREYARIRQISDVCPDIRKWGTAPALRSTGPSPVWGGRAGCVSPAASMADWSIPSPTWESIGPEGSVSQVLDLQEEGRHGVQDQVGDDRTSEEEDVEENRFAGLGGGSVESRTALRGQLSHLQSAPALGCHGLDRGNRGLGTANALAEVKTNPNPNPKQLLRCLREASLASSSRHQAHSRLSKSSSLCPTFPPFHAPDDWDDTGIFTHAPRPKTVPGPVSPRSPLIPRAAAMASAVRGRGRRGKKRIAGLPPGEGGDGRAVSTKSRVGKRGVNEGRDVTVEFMGAREGAMVNLAQALARRSLPWQAQLCPRALQDFEIARVRIFHEQERERAARYANDQGAALEKALAVQEEWKESFAQGQRILLQDTLTRVKETHLAMEAEHVEYMDKRRDREKERVVNSEGQARAQCWSFEKDLADQAWLAFVGSLANRLWNPDECKEEVQAHEAWKKKDTEGWVRRIALSRHREDCFIWLAAAAGTALGIDTLDRWEHGIVKSMQEDERRAANDRDMERDRMMESYQQMLKAAAEADKGERQASRFAWKLQGWLALGSHKLVQQSLRVLINPQSHPYEVRKVLWEVRQAADFAETSRQAAAAQQSMDTREAAKGRVQRRAAVLKHRGCLVEEENARSHSEDVSRARGAHELHHSLREKGHQRMGETEVAFEQERARVCFQRQTEDQRISFYAEEDASLATGLKEEINRMGQACVRRQLEEEEAISSQVKMASLALADEVRSSRDCEVLFEEMMAREEDIEDCLSKEWMDNQREAAHAALMNEVAEAQDARTKAFSQWSDHAASSAEGVSKLDQAIFLNPITWGQPQQETTEKCSTLHTAPKNVGMHTTTDHTGHKETKEPLWWAVATRAEEASVVEKKRIQVAWAQEKEHRDTAAREEEEACKRRARRREALTWLTESGAAARWDVFWATEGERARMSAAAGDMSALRWKERQQAAATAFWSGQGQRLPGLLAKVRATYPADEVQGLQHSGRKGDGGGDGLQRGPENQIGATNSKDGHKENISSHDPSAGDEVQFQGEGGRESEVSATVGSNRMVPASDISEGIPDIDSEGLEGGGGDSHDLGISAQFLDPTNKTQLGGERFEGKATGLEKKSNDKCIGAAGSREAKAAPEENMTEIRANPKEAELSPATVKECGSEPKNLPSVYSEYSKPNPKLTDGGPVGQGPFVHMSTLEGDDNQMGQRSIGGEELLLMSALEEVLQDKEEVDLAQLGLAMRDIPGGTAVLMLADGPETGANGALRGIRGDGGKDTSSGKGMIRSQGLRSAANALVKMRSLLGARVAGVAKKVMRTETEEAVDSERIPEPEELSKVAGVDAIVTAGTLADELSENLDKVFKNVSNIMDRDTKAEARPRLSMEDSPSVLVRAALEKYSLLLPKQHILALTALLAARIEDGIKHGDGRNGSKLDSEHDDPSDTQFWRAEVEGALLMVKTSSLEHAVMWASLCHNKAVEDACIADLARNKAAKNVAATKWCMGNQEQSTIELTDRDLELEQNLADVKENCDEVKTNAEVQFQAESLVSIKDITHSLSRISGLAISPLWVLAASLPCSDTHPSFEGIDGSHVKVNTDRGEEMAGGVEGVGGLGNGEAATWKCFGSDGDDKVVNPCLAVRSLLRLLSPASIKNIARAVSRESYDLHSPLSGDTKIDQGSRPVPEPIAQIPGHPAIGDLSALDAETLKQCFQGLVQALDTAEIGALPKEALLAALGSGRMGFQLTVAQSQAVLNYAGCLPVYIPAQKPGETRPQHEYLGFPPETPVYDYKPLFQRIPALLRLLQASYRLCTAAGTNPSQDMMSSVELALQREKRRTNERTRGPAVYGMAIESICTRMKEAKHAKEKSLERQNTRTGLEAQRERARTMFQSLMSTRSQVIQTIEEAAETASTDKSGVGASNGFGTEAEITGVQGNPIAIRGERGCWTLAWEVMERGREGLLALAMDHGREMLNREMVAIEQECTRWALENETRREAEEPLWWGAGLAEELNKAFQGEVLHATDVAEGMREALSKIEEDIAATWKEEINELEEAASALEAELAEVEKKFEEQRVSAQEASKVSRRSSMVQSGPAGHIQTKLNAVALWQDTLDWVNKHATPALNKRTESFSSLASELHAHTERAANRLLILASNRLAQCRLEVAQHLQETCQSWEEELKRRRKERKSWHRGGVKGLGGDEDVALDDSSPSKEIVEQASRLAEGEAEVGVEVLGFVEAITASLSGGGGTGGGGDGGKHQHTEHGNEATAGIQRASDTACLFLERGGSALDDRDRAMVETLLGEAGRVRHERLKVCSKIVQDWWTSQLEAVADGFNASAWSVEERRVRREVGYLLSVMIEEVEDQARADSLVVECHNNLQSMHARVTKQFDSVASSLTTMAEAAGVDSREKMRAQAQVVTLKENALLGRVSAGLVDMLATSSDGLAMSRRQSMEDPVEQDPIGHFARVGGNGGLSAGSSEVGVGERRGA